MKAGNKPRLPLPGSPARVYVIGVVPSMCSTLTISVASSRVGRLSLWYEFYGCHISLLKREVSFVR